MTEAVVEFTCNICGAANRCPEHRLQREGPSCSVCGSSVRTRAIILMLTEELFGVSIPLSDLPRIKGLRGIGFSDSSTYAERLAARFDYHNTYYHKDPQFDITNIPETELGAYDFVISSEVFEHVPPPPEAAFRNAFRLLKPNGVFLMTVPYALGDRTIEHFPDLHDYGLAQLSDRTVMVNRTRTGDLQVFDDLVFHGGGGSTLEMRCFTESDLRAMLSGAGFSSVQVHSQTHRPFGIVHQESWSLPMAGRKDSFVLRHSSVRELMEQWTALVETTRRLEVHIRSLENDLAENVRWANARVAECEADVKNCNEWAHGLEAEAKEKAQWAQRLDVELKERTDWALVLEKELGELKKVLAENVELAKRYQAQSDERTLWAQNLQREIEELRAQVQRTSGALWTKAGRALRLVR